MAHKAPVMDAASVRHAYRRWAPVYDFTFGLIAEAKSGAMAMVGMPGEPPPLFRISIADMYAGIHGVADVRYDRRWLEERGLARFADGATDFPSFETPVEAPPTARRASA